MPSLSLPDVLEHYTADLVAQSESVRLFSERARAAFSGFALTDPNASAVARLCRKLDGIPLALELAAARLSVLPVEQLANRVEDSLRLLNSGSRVAPPRQQTLRATLEWSHGLLSDTEQLLFRRLSVFAGGWRLEAAETICAGEGVDREEVLELLARLVDKSLALSGVGDSGTGRYRLLETLRQLGNEYLAAAGETTRFRDRHLVWFVSEAEAANARSSDWHRWFPWFYQDQDNLRSALDWAVKTGRTCSGMRLAAAMHPFWAFGAYAGEGQTKLETLLALPDAHAYPGPRAACLIRLANLMRVCGGDLSVARSHGEQGLTLAREIGDIQCVHLATRLVGAIAGLQHDDGAAVGLFQEGVDIARDQGAGWEWEYAKSLSLIGWLRRLQGDPAHARPLLEEAIRKLRGLGDRLTVAENLGILADVALQEGRAREARAHAQESLELSVALGAWPNAARAFDVLVRHAAAEGRFARAVRLAGAVSAMRPRVGTSSVSRPDVVEHARRELGDVKAAASWSEGQAMTLGEAVAFALNTDAVDSASPGSTRQPGLTIRETEVLRLLASGESNRQIAAALVLSVRTVERHIENVYAKIGANGRAAATAYALRLALV